MVFFSIFLNIVYSDNFFVQRAGEFESGALIQTSSAAARFINPIIPLADEVLKSTKSYLFGFGPRTQKRDSGRRDYDAHDPTWSKLVYDYGFFGGAVLSSCFLFTSLRYDMPNFYISIVFIAQWLLCGGHFLCLEIFCVYVFLVKASKLFCLQWIS